MKCFGLFASLLFSLGAFAQTGYNISVDIDGYTPNELYLAYYLGDKQYIQDTVQRNDKGLFVFQGNEALPQGMYLVVMAPDNNFFQLLIDTDQEFAVTTSTGANQVEDMKFKGSDENVRFYDYLRYLEDQRPLAAAIQAKMDTLPGADNSKQQAELEALNEKVLAYQRDVIKRYPQSFTAAIIKANMAPDIPEFTGTPEEKQNQQWRWLQNHYFDNMDPADERLLRTPFFFSKVDYYIQKLQIQHPDTLSLAVDKVLKLMQPAEKTFQYYLIHFLNFYAASKFVGMDAVYVFLVDNYYAKGLAPWTEEEQLVKIIDNANRLRPLLIGRTAPNIRMQDRNGNPVALHDVQSPYTVLYFWRHDCGHCKTSTPVMKEFYEKFKDRGVTLFAVCAKLRDEVPDCWKYVDENDLEEWMHTVDPTGRSGFMSIYDLRTTPQIYILDQDKIIISKRLGAEQLEDFMNQLLKDKTAQ